MSFCYGAWKLFVLLSILSSAPSSAQDSITFDQGWRKHVNLVLQQDEALHHHHQHHHHEHHHHHHHDHHHEVSYTSPYFQESWSLRDKGFRSARRTEFQMEVQGPPVWNLFFLNILFFIAPIIFGVGACMKWGMIGDVYGDFQRKLGISSCSMEMNQAEKTFHKLSNEPLAFGVSNMELVQQALIVFRHNSTRGWDRALELLDSAGVAASKLVHGVRKSRHFKKEDPDADLLEIPCPDAINIPCPDIVFDDINTSSLMVMDDKVDAHLDMLKEYAEKHAQSHEMHLFMDELGLIDLGPETSALEEQISMGHVHSSNLESIDLPCQSSEFRASIDSLSGF